MKVSVIVPLYNKAPYVSRALKSITAQTFGDFEIIVVNDGSTDGSEHVAARHLDQRLRIVHQGNGGPGAARNRGLAESKGELIAFLDADDEWVPEYLECSIREIEKAGPRVASITSGYFECAERRSTQAMWRRRGITDGIQRVRAVTPAQVLSYMLSYIWPCSTVVRAWAAKHYGGFFDRHGCRFGEDATLFLKILLNHPVLFTTMPRAIFHRDASSLSGNYQKARPIEPFLQYPGEVAAVCPPELRPLLDRFYAVRACKTAAMLGVWGDWRQAQGIVRSFVSIRDWQCLLFLPALIGCTPLAPIIWRIVRGGSKKPSRVSPLCESA